MVSIVLGLCTAVNLPKLHSHLQKTATVLYYYIENSGSISVSAERSREKVFRLPVK